MHALPNARDQNANHSADCYESWKNNSLPVILTSHSVKPGPPIAKSE